MKSRGRFERYVVRNGLSPDFSVHGHLDTGGFVEKAEARLKVCKNCLKRLNYQGYLTKGGQVKKHIFERFDQGGFSRPTARTSSTCPGNPPTRPSRISMSRTGATSPAEPGNGPIGRVNPALCG